VDESLPVPPLQFPSLPRKVNGYERSATEEVFKKVASSYEELWVECSRLRAQTVELQEQTIRQQEELSRYQNDERLLGAAIIDANRSAAAIKAEAESEAEAILDEAQVQVDKLLEEVEPEIQAKVEQILSSAQAERARLDGEIERLREFSNKTHEELSSFLAAVVEWHRTSLAENPPIPEVAALEEALDVSSLLNREAAESDSDANGRTKPKRLSSPRLSRPS
jgi:cell division septum initiation protein DivIVA